MRAPTTSNGPLLATLAFAARVVNRLRETYERRRVVQTLASFDDHMLRDIGLTRFDLDSALVEPTLADPTLILADRARELRRSQRAMALEAQARAALTPAVDRPSPATLRRRAA